MEMLIAIAVGFVLLAILGYVEYTQTQKRKLDDKIRNYPTVKRINVESKDDVS